MSQTPEAKPAFRYYTQSDRRQQICKEDRFFTLNYSVLFYYVVQESKVHVWRVGSPKVSGQFSLVKTVDATTRLFCSYCNFGCRIKKSRRWAKRTALPFLSGSQRFTSPRTILPRKRYIASLCMILMWAILSRQCSPAGMLKRIYSPRRRKSSPEYVLWTI